MAALKIQNFLRAKWFKSYAGFSVVTIKAPMSLNQTAVPMLVDLQSSTFADLMDRLVNVLLSSSIFVCSVCYRG